MQTPQIIHNTPSDEYYFKEGCFIWELANSEADNDLSIARARVLTNTATTLHQLADTIERYIILEGKGDVRLAEQTAVSVSAGDVVIIPENCPQSICNTGEDDLIFLVVCTPRFVVENYRECTTS